MTEFNKDELASDPAALGRFNDDMVEEFRTNGGKVGGLGGGELLLLHTTGAKSGEPRMNPLAYLSVDGHMLVVGSYLGAAKDPAWVHNLRAHPRARVEVGTDSYDVVATELPRERRDAVWAQIAASAPVLGEYQQQTSRVIPLFELARA